MARNIVTHISPSLKTAGFRKQRNGFNRRLENGLIHQFSLFLIPAHSFYHGKFYFHAGCYVPQAELYRKNVTDPKWVPDSLCCIRGLFLDEVAEREEYLDVKAFSETPSKANTYVENALDALSRLSDPMRIFSGDEEIDPFHFETPRELVLCCLLIGQGKLKRARTTLLTYLETVEKKEMQNRFTHISHVQEWATQQGLL